MDINRNNDSQTSINTPFSKAQIEALSALSPSASTNLADKQSNVSESTKVDKHSRQHLSRERKTAQMHIDKALQNSGLLQFNHSKYEAKQKMNAEKVSDFHERSQKMGIYSYSNMSNIQHAAGRFYSFCREQKSINSIDQCSYKFIVPYLDYCKEKGNTAAYIHKVIIPALSKFNIIVNQEREKNGQQAIDYYKKCQKWYTKNKDTCKKSDRVNNKNKAFSDVDSLIRAIKDDKCRLVAEIQSKFGYRAGDISNINVFFKDNKCILINAKEGQKYKSMIGEKLYNKLRSYCNENGLFRLSYKKYNKEIKAAAIKTGQYEKGKSTHSLRYSYVQKKYLALIEAGYSEEKAHAMLTEALFHHRKDADKPYLQSI